MKARTVTPTIVSSPLPPAGSIPARIMCCTSEGLVTLAKLASEVERQTGKPLIYNDLLPEVYRGILERFSLPTDFVANLVDVDVNAREGWLQVSSDTLSGLLGRLIITMASAVAAMLGQLIPLKLASGQP